MDVAQATQVVHDLESQVVHHKSEIKRHRRELHFTMSQLARFEEQCRRAGIKIIINRKGEEEGELHGRNDSEA